ncbi:MAG: folylpolyglutamate synthase/dihydrofolate synthase family protein [Myxococcota bacterium]
MTQHPVLERAVMFGVRLGLDRMRQFLGLLDEPHLSAPVVHVAGTNGKGSVCAMVTAILVEAGYRVGTTLSPHVEVLNERVQIDGVPVDDAELTEALDRVARTRDRFAASSGTDDTVLTYFEIMIAAAFDVFARRNVDVQVVEVGLGGRLDATNVVSPVCTAIVSLGLDHMAQLGPDIPSIAREKAGICKPGVPVVVGPLPPEGRAVVETIARQRGCPLWGPPTLRRESRADGTVALATPDGGVGPLTLGLQGPHQAGNAMVVLGIVHQLRRQGFVIDDAAVVAGLERATVPARLERLAPGLLVDGAHNPDAAAALAVYLERETEPGGRILLLGMGERDPRAFVEPLAPLVDEIVTTRGRHPKARDPESLALALEGMHPVIAVGGPIEEALPDVVADARLTIVTGSLFVAGAARALVREGVLNPPVEEGTEP